MSAILGALSGVWSLLTSNLEWVASALGLFFAAMFGRERGKRKQAEDYIETRRRIDEVDSDPIVGDVSDWLRNRGKSDRDL